MSVHLPVSAEGVDLANFAKHGIVREMITRRDMWHPRYGAPPMYYAVCCDGFQDVAVSALAACLPACLPVCCLSSSAAAKLFE